jgi:hypothetical protein
MMMQRYLQFGDHEYFHLFLFKEPFMLKSAFILTVFAWLLSSCEPWDQRTELPAEVQGYVPVYASPGAVKNIAAGPPRATVNGGKIYTTGSLLFQVEKDSGIHVINYANPASPQKLGFIRSVLCKEISVKNGFIYTNNLSDLVVIDINDMNNVHEVSRIADVFPDLALQYPAKTNPLETIYFECPDPFRGIVTSWQLTTIKNPKCWR